MKSPYLMPVGCIVAMLLLLFLPSLGVSSGWALVLAITAMLGCHMLHFPRRKHGKAKTNSSCH